MDKIFLLIFLLDAFAIVKWGGFLFIALLTFLETGILIGLIIPGGETLLFTAGILSSTRVIEVNLITMLLVLAGAGVLGDISGFIIGKKFGPRLNKKEDTWYFKKKYLDLTRDFYEKHRYASLILGKFLPVIRPFNPVLSGMTNMAFFSFFSISVIATLLYISSFTLAGYFLGKQFPQIQNYLPWIIPISIIIALITVFRQIKKNKNDKPGINNADK